MTIVGKISILLSLGISIMSASIVSGQYLRNPSLEGQPISGGQQPYEWQSRDSWSDPDLFDEYTPPGSGKTYPPIDGSIFALYRSRGTTYAETWHAPRQREYSYQELLRPLETHSCFMFSAYLAFNEHHKVNDANPELQDKAFPLKFQLWGGNSAYSRDTLLLESKLVENLEFEKYTFHFTTGSREYSWLLFEVQWDTILSGRLEPYNGMMLIDNMVLERVGQPSVTLLDTLYYRGDGLTQLNAAPGADYYIWDPSQFLSNGYIQSPVMLNYFSDFTVMYGPEYECPTIEKYTVLFDCDTVYPGEYYSHRELYYKYEKNIYLNASPGVTYQWDPSENLSAYDVQSPYMTGYNESYVVTINDKYGCTLKEVFNIVPQCDTLYPQKSMLIVDTLLTGNASIQLTTKYGWAVSEWSPDRFLSCPDCASPIATPEVSTTYSVQLEDDFGCSHEELFRLDVKLEAPNVITPNEDGFNDCFKILGLPENSFLYIYTKNGELLYSASPYTMEKCWQGFDNSGRMLETGTYWYVLGHNEYGTLQTGFIFVKR